MNEDYKERRNTMFDKEFYDKMNEMHGDVKHLVTSLKHHVEEDEKVQGEIKRDLEFHQKLVYGGLGIVAFIEFIRPFFK